MQSLLAKFLRKRNITNPDQLSPDERKTFDHWETVLGKRELSIDDLKQFCAARIDHIETKWKDLSVDNAKKAELIPYHTVYKTLLAAINAPESERIALEKVLLQMI